jgi:2-keto-4-pentenoate hydratase
MAMRRVPVENPGLAHQGTSQLNADLEAGVQDLLAARAARSIIPDLVGARQPATHEDGYRMQAALAARWDDRIVGWKVGATSKQVQALFGVPGPLYGPVFARTVAQSAARCRVADFQHRMLESEFAFRFGRDLPARAAPYTREEVLDAVEALIPAIEIISPRFDRLTVDRIPQLIADCGGNGGAVLGTPVPDWRSLDLPSLPVELRIDGVVKQAGTGAAVLGDPRNVLEWFVETFRAQGLDIAKGLFVMTGTMTGIHAPAPGEQAVADFGALGTVEVVFE